MDKRIELGNISRFSKGESVLSAKEIVDFYVKDGSKFIGINDLSTTIGFREFRNEIKKHDGLTGIYSVRLYGKIKDDIKVIYLVAKNFDGLTEINDIISKKTNTYYSHGLDSPVVSFEYIRSKKNILIGTEFDYYLLEDEELSKEFKNYEVRYDLYQGFDFIVFDYYNLLSSRTLNNIKNKEHLDERIRVSSHRLMKENIIPILTCSGNSITKEDVLCVRGLGKEAGRFLLSEKELRNGLSLLKEETLDMLLVENPNMLFGDLKDVFLEIEENELNEKEFEFLELDFLGRVTSEGFKKVCCDKAKGIFKGVIPEYVQDRINKEFEIVDMNELYIYYVISKTLKENKVKYIPKGKIANLYISYLIGITDINPLKPYYSCECGYFEVSDYNLYSKYDLKEKVCPRCSKKLIKNGYNLPNDLYERNREISFEIDLINYNNTILAISNEFKDRFFNRVGNEYGYIFHKVILDNLSEDERLGINKRAKNAINYTLHRENEYVISTCDLSPYAFGLINERDIVDELEGTYDSPYLYKVDIAPNKNIKEVSFLEDESGIKVADINIDEIDVFDFFMNEDFEYLFEDFENGMKSNLIGPPTNFMDVVRLYGYEKSEKSLRNINEIEPFSYIEDIVNLLHKYDVPTTVIKGIINQVLDIKNGRNSVDLYDVLKSYGLSEAEIENLNSTYHLINKSYGIYMMRYYLYLVWFKLNSEVAFGRFKNLKFIENMRKEEIPF